MDEPSGRGRREPAALGDVLGRLIVARGYGRLRGGAELEEAWATAVGPDVAARTKVGGVRHGVLTITVAHPTLLGELAAFRKAELLKALRRDAPGTVVHDLRFRVGPVA